MDRTLTHQAFVAQMKDWPSEKVFEVEDKIRDLTAHPGWEALFDLIEAGREQAYTTMEGGPTLDRAQYARHIGWLAGLKQLPEIAEAIFVKADQVRESISALEETNA